MSKTIKIQEVAAHGCKKCDKAKEILEDVIKPQFPEVEIEYIDMATEEGTKMVQEYNIMSSPGIVVDGELFSVGGLNEEKLVATIKSKLSS